MSIGVYILLFAIVLILLLLVWWWRRRKLVKPSVRAPYTEVLSYPYPVYYVNLPNGMEIAYVDEGGGSQIIVFVHGLGSYLSAWQRNIEGLKKHYRCIALDLPNYGKSQPGDFPFTMTFFAETVAALILELGLRRVVLAGHSMGGQVAMTTVLNTDVKIEKLILVAPAGFEVFTPRDKRWMLGFFRPEVVSAASKEQVEQHLAANFSGNRTPFDARFMSEDRLLMREYPDYLQTYARMIPKCTAAMLNEPVYERMPQIDIPTLIIYGKEDMLIPNRFLHAGQTPAKIAKDGQSRIPGSELMLVPSSGHFVMWEGAPAVNERIRRFLK